MTQHPKQSAYTEARIAYWEEYEQSSGRFDILRRGYRERLIEFYQFLIPPGMRVLELGSGEGDVLAAVKPVAGVGVDFCPSMIHRAHAKYPGLRFVEGDAHFVDLKGETFDFIIVSDLVNDLWDVQQAFTNALHFAHPGTRIIINSFSRLWEGPRRIAEMTGFAKRQPLQNWLTREDLENLLYLADFEVIRTSQEVLLPLDLPLISSFANKVAVKLWPIRHLGLTNFVIARPRPHAQKNPEPIVSVVVAARNEEGNVANIFDRVPQMGGGTELIFVEGGSKDDTYAAIEREIAARVRWDRRVRRSFTGKPVREKGTRCAWGSPRLLATC